MNKIWWLVFGWLAVQAVQAQENRYMVFFSDKEGTPFTVSAPDLYLSDRAIARREKQGIVISDQDFPVNANYVAEVKEEGAMVMYATRWMNGVLVQMADSLVAPIQDLAFVSQVTLVAPGSKPTSAERRTKSRALGKVGNEVTSLQTEILGIDRMHEDGFRGEGMQIAIFDAGFPGVDIIPAFDHIFQEGRFNDSVSYNFVTMDPEVFTMNSHGTEVASTIAAYSEGEFVGGAYKASFQFYVTEHVSDEHHIEEYNWLFAAERADSAGVDIITSSLGYNTFDSPSVNYTVGDMDGTTAVITKAAQWASDRGILVVVSAGNEGTSFWEIITAPADAKGVLAVGGVDSSLEFLTLSSMGPTADGRIKPDVSALAGNVAVIRPNGSQGYSTGTSFAAPVVTSLAAGIWQLNPYLTNLEVIEVLKSTASQASVPNNEIGYGIPSYLKVLDKLQVEEILSYPNPVTDTFFIKPKNPAFISQIKVEIVDPRGAMLSDEFQMQFDWINNTYQADWSHIPSGVYLVQIQYLGKTELIKVVKQ